LAGHDELYLDLRTWRELPLGLQRGVLREAIHTLRASLRNINWAHVERAVWLCREGATGQKATLAAGLEVEIGYDTLRVGPEDLYGIAGVPQLVVAHALIVPGTTQIGGGRVEITRAGREALPADFAGGSDPWTAFLDADAVGPELWLRSRQPGDRFQPQGMAGHSMKLNEFMINLKVPQDARAGWPLLIGRGGIAWVCGLRVAEWVAVRETTREAWVVRLSPAP
jgi:tRNA(Ile)-lysidine synthase